MAKDFVKCMQVGFVNLAYEENKSCFGYVTSLSDTCSRLSIYPEDFEKQATCYIEQIDKDLK